MGDRARGGRSPLAGRFLIYYALTFVLLIGVTGVFIERSTRTALINETIKDLEVMAEVAGTSLPADESDYQEWAATLFEASGFRVTVVDINGVVRADSHSDPAVMENHATRPEVMIALSGELGTATRTSASTGFEQLYLALPPEDDLIIRTSVASRVIASELNAVRRSIIAISLITGLAGIGLVAYLARRMTRPITELTEQSLAVANGELDISPRRSSVRELDQLGFAISSIAEELGRRLAEAERANEYLEVVLGALDQGTVLIDGDGAVAYANRAAESLLGAIASDLANLSPYQCQAVVREARETGATVERLIEHGKPPRRLRAVATPFTEGDRTLLVVIDVTAEERTASVRRDFVANASHELKTPVATIIASADALRIATERRDESAMAFADQIEASARQMDGLVSDLLDLSRLEREEPQLVPVRLDLVVEDEVERIRSRAQGKQLAVEVDDEEAIVLGSHRDLSVAVRNLLDNAVHYTDKGGIDVAISLTGDEAVLTIQDSGVGIPMRDIDRVFERFYRVDADRSRATGGTGLGLSIVKHVVESHRGTVEVESQLGAGSLFTVRLPLAGGVEAPVAN